MVKEKILELEEREAIINEKLKILLAELGI